MQRGWHGTVRNITRMDAANALSWTDTIRIAPGPFSWTS